MSVTEQLREQILDLIHREVVLATGCTEPGAVALAVAKAKETLGAEPQSVTLRLSKNVFKNAMGVGIPGTGMIGLPIAVAMAVTAGDSARGLETLNLTSGQIDTAKEWLAIHSDAIDIQVCDSADKLYIECLCHKDADTARTVISGRHTRFTLIERNGAPIVCDDRTQSQVQEASQSFCIESFAQVYAFALTTDLKRLDFINQAVQYNEAASAEGLKGYGLHAGRILLDNAGSDIVHTVVAHTVAASDARMDGCTMPVYSNSGSGNQGIACTLPVYKYGTMKGCSAEQITRALVLSHLTSIYVKHGIGRLSALCGIVNASIGVAAGLVFLQGGGYAQISYAVKNLINTIAGMVCDGAKPSCALKMASGLYAAFVAAELACHNHVVEETDGLCEYDIDNSIRNLGRLGHDGMNETDNMVLDIMTHKQYKK
ncbi:MAG: hypothetical protein AUK63_694 [bacterium P3]|nr:MAG: hypothetical protein AUK63_694 [bacterium P3]KWW42177.1 MAG: hypothetical protein F083_516 [bacterium F083]